MPVAGRFVFGRILFLCLCAQAQRRHGQAAEAHARLRFALADAVWRTQTRGTSGAQMQEETFYVSFDGQKIVRGVVYDISQNPFKTENDKLKTEGRPSMGTPGASVVISFPGGGGFGAPDDREPELVLADELGGYVR